MIVHNQFIAISLAREVAVNYARLQITLLACLQQHTFQAWLELLLNKALIFLAMRLASPVQTEERLEIHTLSHIFQTDSLQYTRPPEWGNGNRQIAANCLRGTSILNGSVERVRSVCCIGQLLTFAQS